MSTYRTHGPVSSLLAATRSVALIGACALAVACGATATKSVEQTDRSDSHLTDNPTSGCTLAENGDDLAAPPPDQVAAADGTNADQGSDVDIAAIRPRAGNVCQPAAPPAADCRQEGCAKSYRCASVSVLATGEKQYSCIQTWDGNQPAETDCAVIGCKAGWICDRVAPPNARPNGPQYYMSCVKAPQD